MTGPCSMFKSMRDMLDKYKKDKKASHCINLIVSLCKIVTALIFCFAHIESRNFLPSYTMKSTYNTRLLTVTKPGHPSGILINEYVFVNVTIGSICKPATTTTTSASPLALPEQSGAPANEAYPDVSDCTAHWTRTCVSDFPSLNYMVCPEEGEAFGSNTPDFDCINSRTCCTSLNVTDCGSRTQYNDSCLNNDTTECNFMTGPLF
jgi:hypothetical protein